MSTPDHQIPPPEERIESVLGAPTTVTGESCPDLSLLRRVVRGMLPPDEATRAMEHVALCGTCRKAYADLERAWAAHQAMPGVAAVNDAPRRTPLRPLRYAWVAAVALLVVVTLRTTVRETDRRPAMCEITLGEPLDEKGTSMPGETIDLQVILPKGPVPVERPPTIEWLLPADVEVRDILVILTETRTGATLYEGPPDTRTTWRPRPGLLRTGGRYMLSVTAEVVGPLPRDQARKRVR